MIDLRQAVLGVSMGAVLLVFGLVPGLLQQVAEGVRNAMSAFQNGSLLSPRFQWQPGSAVEGGRSGWLAVTGLATIAGAVLAYYWN